MQGKRCWRRRLRLMTERHGTVFSARRQMCGRGLNVVVARWAIQQFCRTHTCKQRCRRSQVGRSRHRQVMVKTGHMPTRQNGHYKRSHESCTKKTRSLRRGRNTAKCRPKVQGAVLKMMKVRRWTWRMNRTAKRSWSSGREKLLSKCGCLMELQNCRKRWWQSRKRSCNRNCRTSSRGAMISCQNVKSYRSCRGI